MQSQQILQIVLTKKEKDTYNEIRYENEEKS